MGFGGGFLASFWFGDVWCGLGCVERLSRVQLLINEHAYTAGLRLCWSIRIGVHDLSIIGPL
jgi:hypothetical protein